VLGGIVLGQARPQKVSKHSTDIAKSHRTPQPFVAETLSDCVFMFTVTQVNEKLFKWITSAKKSSLDLGTGVKRKGDLKSHTVVFTLMHDTVLPRMVYVKIEL
jgi:hypothetical protein